MAGTIIQSMARGLLDDKDSYLVSSPTALFHYNTLTKKSSSPTPSNAWSLQALTQKSYLAKSPTDLLLVTATKSNLEVHKLLKLEGIRTDTMQVTLVGDEVKILAAKNVWIGGEKLRMQVVTIKVKV